MTNEEILRKAINKALVGGFRWSIDLSLVKNVLTDDIPTYSESGFSKIIIDGIIFSPAFAKAFWDYSCQYENKKSLGCA